MEETEIQSIYSHSELSVVPSPEPAVSALPFRAGVLTQRTGHFAQVVKHGPSQGSIAGVVKEASDVGSYMKTRNVKLKFIQAEKSCGGTQRAQSQNQGS